MKNTRAPVQSSEDEARPPGEPLQIAVLLGQGVTIHPLPPHGAVTLGRGDEATIVIAHTSVSRLHARLHIGRDVLVEDLGSTNGTRVRDAKPSATDLLVDARLQPGKTLRLCPGDGFQIGSVEVVLQRARTIAPGAEDGAPLVADEAMRRVYETAERASRGTISVLLLGETGTGKEVLAHAIHRFSPRAKRPFLALSCVALSETLLESELFGHEKGAFTGATAAKVGLLQSADGGTVFLDEIGELPPALQAKLLRVIEERKVLPVGSLAPRPIDVRFLSATNRDLDAEVAAGRFRKDLLYRLNGVTLALPPLRDRPAEVPLLARRFVTDACRKLDRPTDKVLSPAALAALVAHPFPGNIRELKNAIERAVLLAPGDTLLPEHLPFESGSGVLHAPRAPEAPADGARAPAAEGATAADPTAPAASLPTLTPPPEQPLRDVLRAREREKILEALARCDNNQTRAAVVLGISRRTLVDRLTEHAIPRPRKR